MARCKRSGRPPQAQHCGRSKSSRHDKRKRLAARNPERRHTEQASVPLTGGVAASWFRSAGVKDDIEALQACYDWGFRTKHEMALDLCQRVMGLLRAMGTKAGFVVVFDDVYAAESLVRTHLDTRRAMLMNAICVEL